jgi:FMN-dependent NADH-azoreductase
VKIRETGVRSRGDDSINILFIDGSIRPPDISRTHRVCSRFLAEYRRRNPDARVSVLPLRDEPLAPLSFERITKRDALLAEGAMTNDMFVHAIRFAEADRILVGAPYWDLMFPSLLKIYLENVSVCGITFRYSETGPRGLCRAEKLLYVTTAGGVIGAFDFGSEYLRGLCTLFGIADFQSFPVEELDIRRDAADDILEEALGSVERLAARW